MVSKKWNFYKIGVFLIFITGCREMKSENFNSVSLLDKTLFNVSPYKYSFVGRIDSLTVREFIFGCSGDSSPVFKLFADRSSIKLYRTNNDGVFFKSNQNQLNFSMDISRKDRILLCKYLVSNFPKELLAKEETILYKDCPTCQDNDRKIYIEIVFADTLIKPKKYYIDNLIQFSRDTDPKSELLDYYRDLNAVVVYLEK